MSEETLSQGRERHLRQALSEMQKRHQREAEPLWRGLVDIEARKPQPPIFIDAAMWRMVHKRLDTIRALPPTAAFTYTNESKT